MALRWGNVDLRRGEISTTKSRHMQAEGAPNTVGSEREITLLPIIVELLKNVKPRHVTEDEHAFLNQDGNQRLSHLETQGLVPNAPRKGDP